MSENVGLSPGTSFQHSIASLNISGYILLLPNEGRLGQKRFAFICSTVSNKMENKKCHKHVTNAPKELVYHKTHLRKVSCNIA